MPPTFAELNRTAQGLITLAILVIVVYYLEQAGELSTDIFASLTPDDASQSDDEFQETLQDLEDASPDAETQEQSHDEAVDNVQDTTTTHEQYVSRLRDQIEDARTRRDQVQDQLTRLDDRIDQIQREVEERCNWNPYQSWETLAASIVSAGYTVYHNVNELLESDVVRKITNDQVGCETAKQHLTILKRTRSEVKDAVTYWENRITTLQTAIREAEQQDDGIGIGSPSLSASATDVGLGMEVTFTNSGDGAFYGAVKIEMDTVGDGVVNDTRTIPISLSAGEQTTYSFTDAQNARVTFYKSSRQEDVVTSTGWLVQSRLITDTSGGL